MYGLKAEGNVADDCYLVIWRTLSSTMTSKPEPFPLRSQAAPSQSSFQRRLCHHSEGSGRELQAGACSDDCDGVLGCIALPFLFPGQSLREWARESNQTKLYL